MSQDAHDPTGRSPSPDPRELLDAYIDGVLEGAELAAFEKAMADDYALKAEVDAQRLINASLSRLFHREAPVTLPAAADNGMLPGASTTAPLVLPLKLSGAQETDPKAGKEAGKENRGAAGNFFTRPMPGWTKLAAAVVLVGLAVLYVTGVIDPEAWLNPGRGLIGAEVVYERKVRTGFAPDHVCTTDEAFVKYTNDVLGEPLLIRNTDSVEVVGWSSYEPVLSAGTVVLMAKVDGEEVIVIMDRKKNDRNITPPKSSGLHDFSQNFGGVTLHEITPFDSPRILPLVEWK